jgi:hypothetical protein
MVLQEEVEAALGAPRSQRVAERPVTDMDRSHGD